MKRTLVAVGVLTLMGIGVSSEAFGQKGMGDAQGIARQADKPEIVQLSGTIREIKTEPCKMTTGPSQQGTHLVLKTPSGEVVEIHLGPADEVGQILKNLAVGQQVNLAAFRTEKLPQGAFVAQTLTVDDKPMVLRDKDLRPVWAGGGPKSTAARVAGKGAGKGRWSWGQAAGAVGRGVCGRGQGRGAAMGQGRGQGLGRGAAMGQGRGQGLGRGAAMGQGRGQGLGRGAAMGRGQGQDQGRGAAMGRGQGQGHGAAMGRGRGPGWGARPGALPDDAADQEDEDGGSGDD